MQTKRCSNPIFIFIVLISLQLFAGCGDQGSDTNTGREIKLSHSHAASDISEIHAAATFFKKYVEERSDNLTVRIFANSQLGSEREVYESMQFGSGADAVISGTAILSNFTDRIGVLDLPYLWKSYDHAHEVLDGEAGDELANDLGAVGFEVLAWLDSWGFRNVFVSDDQTTSLEGLRGKKIRTIRSPVYIEAIKLLEASPTPMSFSEVYSAMQTGVIDGFEHTASTVAAGNLDEIASNALLTRHIFGPLVFAFSKARWNQLSENQQELLSGAARATKTYQRELAPEKEAAALQLIQERGVNLHQIDTAPLRERATLLQNRLAGQRNATDLLEKIRRHQE